MFVLSGSVNATDIDANDTQTVSAIDNDEIVSVENDLSVLSANDGTYSDLRDEINAGGNNISLTKSNYIYTACDGGTIEIKNSCVIDGKGAVIDMAGSNIQGFNVSVSGVTIKNLTIKNAKYNHDGGAIYFSGLGAIENCTFISNSAGYSNYEGYHGGGAVYMYSGSVENCNFIDNTAFGHGGALHFFEKGEVTNCNFVNNVAPEGYGAAIWFTKAGSIENCNFNKNNAFRFGGAVYFANPNYIFEVKNCNFTNNKANHDLGGAICFRGVGKVTNCNFINNTAHDSCGAIVFYDNGTATNCNFVNNYGNSDGALLFFANGEVTNCDFINNSAKVEVGAIAFWEDGAVTDCNFINNTASNRAGAIYFGNGGTVLNSNFTGNTAASGSAIYSFYSPTTIFISNSIFLNNRVNVNDYWALQIIQNGKSFEFTLIGQNNLLNALYSGDVNVTNVTYWGANGITNTGNSTISPSKSFNEAGQNITITILVDDILVLNETKLTDVDGKIVLDIDVDGKYLICGRHDEDSYYTEAEAVFTNMEFYANVTSMATYGRNVNITAKSNINSEIMPNLMFAFLNGTKISANYNGGIWWALHRFDGAGDYVVTAEYGGLNGLIANHAVINVLKIKTKLTANTVTAIYNVNRNLVITLKDNQGNPLSGVKVTVDLNGVREYPTDKNGQIRVPTKSLTPNTYTAKITFNGNANYAKSTKNVKVAVIKATPKITAKNIAFKKSIKTKKYAITLNDNTAKPIKNAKFTGKPSICRSFRFPYTPGVIFSTTAPFTRSVRAGTTAS